MTKSRFKPLVNFVDPRTQPDFEPQHWPLCDGQLGPASDSTDLHDRRCIEFLAHFYRVNQLNSQLLQARTGFASPDVIQKLTEQVNWVGAEMELLEDRYAPTRFFGEPVMEGIRYSDVK